MHGKKPTCPDKNRTPSDVAPLAGAFFALLDLIVAGLLERQKAHPRSPDDQPAALKQAAAAAYLSISVGQLKRLRERGRIEAVYLSERTPRYRRRDLDRLLEEDDG
jgi:hypothetical protein